MVSVGFLDPILKGDTARNTRALLRILILATIAAAAISSRLFSVIRELELLLLLSGLSIA